LSSEAPVERYDWWEGKSYLEILDHSKKAVDLSYARDGLPFLLDHDTREQIGLIEEVSVDGDKRIRGLVRFSRSQRAQEIRQDMVDGIRRKVSVGYRLSEDFEQEEQDGVLVRRYRAWRPMEGSSVAVPADYDVGVGRSAVEGAPGRQGTLSSAPQARNERTMSTQDTAAPSGAATQPSDAEKIQARMTGLAALAKEHEMADQLPDWIHSGKSVEAVGAEIRAALQAKLKANTTAPANTGTGTNVSVVARDGGENGTKHGPYVRLGDFYRDVRLAANDDATARNRLMQVRAITGMSETVSADGGYLVQQDLVTDLMQRTYNTGEILKRVRRIGIGANSNGMKFNLINETSRATGSRFGGVRGYWLAEADTKTASKPSFRQESLVLKKIAALVYATDELLEDATALEGVINEAVPAELNFQIEDAIIEGTGAGQPLGILNSGAVVQVAAEVGQDPDSITPVNIAAMWARMWGRSQQNAVWLINQDAFPTLQNMQIGTGAATTLVYMPANGISGVPFGTIYGAPVIPVEYAATVGDVGDIMLVDLSQYLLIDKGGVKTDSSIHVRFINDETVFRFVYRVDGMPMWNTPLTPFKGGSNTQSPFITLAAR
jgi:HK97 family phage major capsid protein